METKFFSHYSEPSCGLQSVVNAYLPRVNGIRTAVPKVTAHSLYSVCGISLARLTRVSRDHRPLGQSHLGDAVIYCSILAVAPTGIFVCFLIYYQAVTNQLTYDKDPDIETHRRPLELSYLQGQHANPKARSQPCKRVLG